MERALTLVSTGTLTIALLRASNSKKTIPLPRTFNLSSGKESTRVTGFSDTAWGKETRSYAKSASSLSADKFKVIIQEAQALMNPIRPRANHGDVIVIDDDEDNKRAHLIDLSDSDG